jgi:rubrerythrin
MISETETQIGMNKTGISMSPLDAPKSVEGAKKLTPVDPANLQTIGENRMLYMREADPLGSIPVPATLRGAAMSLKEMLQQGNQVYIDKLGERLAFERTGTRIYEALISKWDGTADKSMLPPLEMLQRFRDEEHDHFQMLFKTIQELGADPTSVTPSADNMGVASLGLVQVVSDPRTSFAQALDAILIAELADHDSWDLLSQLAELAGTTEAAARFRLALEQEAFHLQKVREWVQQMAMGLPIDLTLQENQKIASTVRKSTEKRQHLG